MVPFLFEEEERGRMKLKESGSSAEGVVAVSLKRSREAATFRPMVDDEGRCVLRMGLGEEEVEEEEEAEEDGRRDRGL